jgi:hypothetical protein
MTTEQQRAVDQVLDLRELTRTTGTKTTRAVNLILQSLPDADLIVVARELSAKKNGGEQ